MLELTLSSESKRPKTRSEKLKEGRQAFGVLLLIFEWGTTWPFYLPDLPIQKIPFSDDIGKVVWVRSDICTTFGPRSLDVQKAILPTITSNFKKTKAAQANKKNGAS